MHFAINLKCVVGGQVPNNKYIIIGNNNNLLQIGTHWCTLVQLGTDWCNLVQIHAVWSTLVQPGATWLQIGVVWCKLVKFAAFLWSLVQLCPDYRNFAIWCSLPHVSVVWYRLV